MGSLIWLIIIGTSIWVFFDAKSIGVKKGQITGLGNLGPFGWFIVCLLLWIVGFPFYIAKRGEFKRINAAKNDTAISEKRTSSFNQDSIEQLEKLSQLKEKGILTEEEFQAKKKEIIG